jgi:hypothetical protein
MGIRNPLYASGDRWYWLRRCEGFRVEAEGEELGTVACVRYGSRLDRPDEIVVQSGRLRRRLRALAVDDVEGVSGEDRLVTVRHGFVPRMA